MGIEGQKSSRDVASEDKRHPWEVFPGDETSANNEGRKEREEDKNKTKKGFADWVKANKVLFVGIVFVAVAVIIGAIVGYNALRKNGFFGGSVSEDDNSIGIKVEYMEKMTLASAPTPEIAFDYATQKLKPILIEGIYNSERVTDYVKLEDNFEVFIKKVDSEEDKITYRLTMLYILFRLGDAATDRAQTLFGYFNEENHELNFTQKYFYLMVQVEDAVANGDADSRNRLLNQIDEEYGEVNDKYVDGTTGEVITDEEEIRKINEAFDKYKKEGE